MAKVAVTDPVILDLQIMATATNYRRWIFDTFSSAIGQRVLEIGAGIGNFTELLLDREFVLPTDIHRPCIDVLKQRFSDRWSPPARLLDAADPCVRDLAPLRFDTVICFNVLEHVADDQAALQNMWNVLQPGGRLLLWVPALPHLFGSVDVALEHHRRYTRQSLSGEVRRAGFLIEGTHYVNFVGILGWWFNGSLLKRREESFSQIGLFDRGVVPWLRPLEAIVPPPVGLSVALIARKPHPATAT